MFDFFKNLFDNIFGWDDEDQEQELGQDEGLGDNDLIFTAGEYDTPMDMEDFYALEERLVDGDNPGAGEYVNTFYDLQEALDYVEGTPENVLQILMDNEVGEYAVYRYNSD